MFKKLISSLLTILALWINFTPVVLAVDPSSQDRQSLAFMGDGSFGFWKTASTSFDPISLTGLGLYGYWQADRSVIGYDSGVNISSVTDLSGNEYTLSEATNFPTYVSSVSALGDVPAFDFSGTLQMLSNTSVDDFSDHIHTIIALHIDAHDGSSGVYQVGTNTINEGKSAYITGAQTISTVGKASTLRSKSTTAFSFPKTMIYEDRWETTDGQHRFYVNGKEISPSATSGATSASAFANVISSVYMGGVPSASYKLNGQIYSMIVLAGNDINSVDFKKVRDCRQYLNDKTGIYTYKNSWAFAGDSRISQQQADTNSVDSVAELMATDIGVDLYEYHNEAKTGELATSAQDKTDKGYYANWINKHGTTSRLVILSGTNDLVASASSSAVIASLLDIATSAITDGFNEVYVLTIPKSASITAGNETSRQAVNTALNAWDVAGVTVIDIASLDAFSDTADTDYYQVDGTHFTTLANQAIADAIEAGAGL
jgi:lysophospholipase L1-like esterase